jgi:hypothetical protein
VGACSHAGVRIDPRNNSSGTMASCIRVQLGSVMSADPAALVRLLGISETMSSVQSTEMILVKVLKRVDPIVEVVL